MVVVASGPVSSFSITIGFPVALAKIQAKALDKGQPTVLCVSSSLAVSLHRSSKTWFLIVTVMLLSWG